MRVTFTDDGWADYCSWSDDRKMLARINRLTGEALREPGAVIGKPEPLGRNLSGPVRLLVAADHGRASAGLRGRRGPPHHLGALPLLRYGPHAPAHRRWECIQ